MTRGILKIMSKGKQKSSGKSLDFNYINAESYTGSSILSLSSIKDFLNKANGKSIKEIYRISNYEENVFLFINGNTAYSIDSRGFDNLEDFEKAENLGFIGNSRKYDNWSLNIKRSASSGSLTDGDLYYHVKGLGYKDYKEFEKSYNGDFYQHGVHGEEYRKITSSGFTEYEDYETFKDSKFDSYDDYVEAMELDIESKSVFEDFKLLEEVKSKLKLDTVEQAHLYVLLAKSKKNKIEFDSIINEIQSQTQWLDSPEWYTEKYESYELVDDEHPGSRENENTMEFDLMSNPVFGSLGLYNQENKIFVKYIGVPAFVDGSNVAWNNQDKDKGEKPSARYIELVIKEAKKLRFKDITVLHDANLKYVVKDKELLNSLSDKYDFKVVPAETDADEFIIAFAKKKKAFIISNDRFRDYLDQHNDDEEFIKTHRLAFMIDDQENVVFGGMDKIKGTTQFDNGSFDRFSGFE